MSFFVLGEYGDLNTLIHLDPKTELEARRAIAWQGVGGYTDRTTFHICTPHPDERATFVSKVTGAKFKAARGSWTQDAWDAFLERTWP